MLVIFVKIMNMKIIFENAIEKQKKKNLVMVI